MPDLFYLKLPGNLAQVGCVCGWKSSSFTRSPFDPSEAIVAYSTEHLKCLEKSPPSQEVIMVIEDYIRGKMTALRDSPMMHAFTKDAFVAQLRMLIELYQIMDPHIPDPSKEFDALIFGDRKRAIALGLDEEPESKWCENTVTQAKILMPGLYY